MQNKYQISL